jgi:hypothetical protein
MTTTRVRYLRNSNNIRQKADGSYTRGDPIAAVASNVNMGEEVIRFAVAVAHPDDHFVRSRARHIAIERLNALPSKKELIARRERGFGSRYDRGNCSVLFTGEDVKKAIASKSGHEITKLVMQEIERLSKLPAKVRKIPARVGKLATAWLARSETPKADSVPTIPSPPQHRDAIPPPPPMPRV